MDNLREKSYEQLVMLRTDLKNEITKIDADLANKDRRDANGRRFTDKEYHTWRALVVQDKALLTTRLRLIKEELQLREHEAPVKYDWTDRLAPRKLGPRELKAAIQIQQHHCTRLKNALDREWGYLDDLQKEAEKRGVPEKEAGLDPTDDDSIISYLEARGYSVSGPAVASKVQLEEVVMHLSTFNRQPSAKAEGIGNPLAGPMGGATPAGDPR
jgi:hypothetical protein